ncbi:Hypothetical predicted protein [Xyrichtys novacula]|uniref:Uncharacterized protein n=1 Tax=Xyrichtys novacula TaxID=13765 RepID=A0AAV1HHA6_XYRNO|nr:Hypothetical predicted protein [Xyrichtys novacula]
MPVCMPGTIPPQHTQMMCPFRHVNNSQGTHNRRVRGRQQFRKPRDSQTASSLSGTEGELDCHGSDQQSGSEHKRLEPYDQSKGMASRQEREQTRSTTGDQSGKECQKGLHTANTIRQLVCVWTEAGLANQAIAWGPSFQGAPHLGILPSDRVPQVLINVLHGNDNNRHLL